LLLPEIGVRHILLKDTQILANGTMQTQEDPEFSLPAPGQNETRQGICAGADNTAGGGSNYTNGHWFFTLNGQIYPTVPITSPAGEIWRITNTSGSATYDLNLFNPAQNRKMMMQVISSDGVSISPPAQMTIGQLTQIGGAKFQPETCPMTAELRASSSQASVCTRDLLLMPGSRVEVWVSYRDAKDTITSAPSNSYAILRTAGYSTGPSGDSWPAVNLARVNFGSQVKINTPAFLGVDGQATQLSTPESIAAQLLAANQAAPANTACKALPPGHMRRIFYGVPTTNPNAFGLAYEELDEKGNVVGLPATDVMPFDPANSSICLPLGPGNTPAYERWQLVNVATEDHNFHIHQVKFRVLSDDELTGTEIRKGIELDNVPLPHADGACGTNPPADLSNPIADWRAGLCTAHPITVEIPFAVAGKFVYHCHILEHEDGGMMAVIQVVPSTN
jgi:FtsP/CotA-like multicopper oxidase with cupredoxin domain